MQKMNFTGNWYFDAGILGFARLMEEVYGWDLERLKKEISENEFLVYYGYFPVAYFYKEYKKHLESLELRQEYIEEIKCFYEEYKKRLGSLGSQNKDATNNKDEVKRAIFEKAFEIIDKFSLGPFIAYEYKRISGKFEIAEENGNYVLKKSSNKKSNIEEDASDDNEESDEDSEDENNERTDDTSDEVPTLYKIVSGFYNRRKNDIAKICNEIRNRKRKKKEIKLSEVLKKDDTLNSELKEEIEKELENKWENNRDDCRYPVTSNFYKNFLFFHDSKKIKDQKELMYKTIAMQIDNDTNELSFVSKTINKLLHSEDDFSNISYTNALPTETFKKNIPYLGCYLICFDKAFSKIGNENFFFYTQNMDYCFAVNKKINLLTKKQERDENKILKTTIDAIFDTIYEYKSLWSLGNMYIISYEKLTNETQENVNYLSIPLLQASVLIDPEIREKLNYSVQYREKGNKNNHPSKSRCWFIKEFIKSKELYPYVLEYSWLCLKNKKKIPTSRLCWILATDAAVTRIYEGKNRPFSKFEDFMNGEKRYMRLRKEINNFHLKFYLLMKNTRELFDENEKESLVYRILSILKRNDQDTFLNLLLMKLNAHKEDTKLHKKINIISSFNQLKDSRLWKYYALVTLFGMVGESNE